MRILVTGAASGLGRGMAAYFAERGYELVLIDRDVDGLAEFAREIASPALFQALDVTSSSEIGEFFSGLENRRVDVLINCAGLQHVSPLEDFSEERWDLLIDVMLKGPFLLSKAVLPGMRKHGFGRIINVGSIHSLVASPFKSAYTAAKHGILGFSKTIALEAAADDITVNTICPAYVRTPLVDSQIRSQALAHGISEQEVIDRIMLEPMPKKAFITVEEIAATAEFLMSDMARNITGQTITIDGGWTAQ